MKRKTISDRVSNISLSAIKEMAMLSAHVEGAASLTWGVPSFRTPVHIRRAVNEALEADPELGKYSLPDGLPSLRRAIAENHRKETGIDVDPDRQIVVTAGNMEGIKVLLQVLIDPGDEVIVTDPGFASHFQQIKLCGGEVVFWPMLEEDSWALDVDSLEALVSSKTKAILLVSPSNPTGKIFSEGELRHIGRVAERHGIMVLVDDPYSHFVYENRTRFFNIASLSTLADHMAYLFSFSKTYAMSGWRIGYMVIPPFLKPEVLKVHDATLICPPRISQCAAEAALTQTPIHLSEFETILARRRELICDRLDALPHVFGYVKPEGAYYVFPRIRADHTDSKQFAVNLLNAAGVTVTPGSAFGPTGEHHVRMAYCVDDSVIESAFDRITDYYGR